ncbi:MAG TPA: aminotransferase class I/II-fold pyridoxal phosphate-dependent enzyme [Bacteroidia bacterium]|nr:aminotransferase class I/II-fold pyridoxal phosphate-dependent enzyme [Bacteroidia bacterium]
MSLPTSARATELKSKHQQLIEIIDQVLTSSSKLGITQLTTEDERFDGRHVRVNNSDLINFGSCSYLGLELDKRLIAAAVDAVQRYGTQFSSSRAYMSVTLYSEIESLLGKIFNKPVTLASTVTLGHISNIPVLVGDHDAVIYDIQVHASVQTALELLKPRNIHLEALRHNRMDILEDRISKLKDKFEKIWFMSDGVYSMYGDFLPVQQLKNLLDKYEQFHLYVDDAHGMSWAGKNGSGYVLNQMEYHPKLFLVMGLAKAFGACGGVLVYPDDDSRRLVRNCGKTMIFSGPIQPPVLGAAVASAKIHLSKEIYKLQSDLKKRIEYFNSLSKNLHLPLIIESHSPITFIGLGKPIVGYNLVRRLMNLGFYVNLSVFPSVSYNNTGLRCTLNLHQQMGDIEKLLLAVSEQLPLALSDSQSSLEEVYKFFRMDSPQERRADRSDLAG